MLPLVVHIERPQGGPTITRAFLESPVRIGRSPFASLRLRDPFVSEWQAVVRFHGERTTYLDLGSRNPTHVRGRPVERNIEIEVDAQTDVRIGSLRLRFERVAVTDAVIERSVKGDIADDDTSFVPGPLSLHDGEKRTGTIALDNPASVLQPQTTISPPPLPHRHMAQVEPRHVGSTLLEAERGLEHARTVWLQAVHRELELRTHLTPVERIHALAQRDPRLIAQEEFRNAAHRRGVDPLELGYIDVSEWLTRVRGSALLVDPAEPVAVTMERVGQLLELFASSYIESRRAHQRARKKLGLERGENPDTVLQRCEDPHALLAYLLEPTTQTRARRQELRRSLGDFAMHQIALLSAVVEGARSMLTQLGPSALDEAPETIDAAAALDTHGSSAGLWPFTARKLWRRFLVRHNDLLHADHFARELFGHEFTRRYHAIADSSTQVEPLEHAGRS